MTPSDPYHGHGGTYVLMPDGIRVPSDPLTGEPMPAPVDPEITVPSEPAEQE